MDNLPTEPQAPLGSQLPPVQPITQPQQFPNQPIPTAFPPQPEVVTQPVNTNPISQNPKSSKKRIIIIVSVLLSILACVAGFFVFKQLNSSSTESEGEIKVSTNNKVYSDLKEKIEASFTK